MPHPDPSMPTNAFPMSLGQPPSRVATSKWQLGENRKPFTVVLVGPPIGKSVASTVTIAAGVVLGMSATAIPRRATNILGTASPIAARNAFANEDHFGSLITAAQSAKGARFIRLPRWWFSLAQCATAEGRPSLVEWRRTRSLRPFAFMQLGCLDLHPQVTEVRKSRK